MKIVKIITQIFLLLSLCSCVANEYYTLKKRDSLKIPRKINVYVYGEKKTKLENLIKKEVYLTPYCHSKDKVMYRL